MPVLRQLTPYHRALVDFLLETLRLVAASERHTVRCDALLFQFEEWCKRNKPTGVSLTDTLSATRFGLALRGVVPTEYFRRRQALDDNKNVNHYVFIDPAHFVSELEKLRTLGTPHQRVRDQLSTRMAQLEARVAALETRAHTS